VDRVSGEDQVADELQQGEVPLSYVHFWRRFWELSPGFRRWIIPGVIRGILRARAFASRELVFLGKGVTIVKRGKDARILIGRGCRIADYCHLEVGATGLISIDTRTVIGSSTRIMAATHVRIGARCMISWNCSIFDSIGHRMWLAGQDEAGIEAPITIGDDVWIGPYTIIMKGVEIGSNSIVGAGSVVRRSLPPNSLAYGNPARRVGQVDHWER
jgi:acetyltransferase-like isoleucine patch superfamily enzyme